MCVLLNQEQFSLLLIGIKQTVYNFALQNRRNDKIHIFSIMMTSTNLSYSVCPKEFIIFIFYHKVFQEFLCLINDNSFYLEIYFTKLKEYKRRHWAAALYSDDLKKEKRNLKTNSIMIWNYGWENIVEIKIKIFPINYSW